MSKKVMYLVVVVLVLGWSSVGLSQPSTSVVAHWQLDGDATDSVGGIDGTLVNGPTFVEDRMMGTHALDLLEAQHQWVDFGNPPELPAGFEPRSMTVWAKLHNIAGNWKWLCCYGSPIVGDAMFVGALGTGLYGGGYADNVIADNIWETDVWHFIALTYDGTTARMYADGVEVAAAAKAWNLTRSVCRIGRQVNEYDEYCDGIVDDVQIFRRVLTPEDIGEVMQGLRPARFSKAWGPNPVDGELAMASETLQWIAGDSVDAYNVYLGQTPELGAGDLVSAGQAELSLPVAGLGIMPDETYYWRVDAVAADGTVFTGDVWTFQAAPLRAWAPSPSDGTINVKTDAALSWRNGLVSLLHVVYLGESYEDVNAMTDPMGEGTMISENSYDPELEPDKTYYWRVDEFTGVEYVKGPIWSFSTVPLVEITDPNLVGYWPLDEGAGATAVDWSGYGNHGSFQELNVGPIEWTDGLFCGSALFGGGSINCEDAGADIANDFTLAAWAKPAPNSAGNYGGVAGRLLNRNGYFGFCIVRHSSNVYRLWIGNSTGNLGSMDSDAQYAEPEWHHVAAVREGETCTLYVDGVAQSATLDYDFVNSNDYFCLGKQYSNDAVNRKFLGSIDDVQLYDMAMTEAEVWEVMTTLRHW